MTIKIIPAASYYGSSAPLSDNSFSNSEVLRKLDADHKGNLIFNGKIVGEAALEVAYNVILSAQNISTSSIQLPHDCDTSRAITFTLQGISTTQDIDWKIDENSPPEPDAITWKGLGLQNIAQERDRVLITYYKKI